MASHRVRLFVLPYGHAPTAPTEEAPGFTVEGVDGDDEVRECIKARLVDWGYTVRSVSALAGAKPGDATYTATVVGKAPAEEPS